MKAVGECFFSSTSIGTALPQIQDLKEHLILNPLFDHTKEFPLYLSIADLHPLF
jgi:hypothetical protein